jgi:hypothetical protein
LHSPHTKAEIEALITGLVPESSRLEYKGAEALSLVDSKKRDEISKDVSAFANAGGGVIIYGVQQYREKDREHLPERITPVNTSVITREWLDQMIGQIQPPIAGLTITPIPVGPAITDVCYAVTIPLSTTAHQAVDGRYYRRRNFERTWMEDYEIREVMNRLKVPALSVSVRVFPRDSDKPRLVIRLRNTSDVMARFFALVVRFPIRVGGRAIGLRDSGHLERGEHAHWGFTEHGGLQPLFPRSTRILKREFDWVQTFTPPIAEPGLPHIEMVAFADNMPRVQMKFDLGEAVKGWASPFQVQESNMREEEEGP